MVNLNTHLAEKLHNHKWLMACIDGKADEFPYRIRPNGKASFDNNRYYPKKRLNEYPTGLYENPAQPTYLVNIPVVYKDSFETPGVINRLLNLFKQEAFGAHFSDESLQTLQARVAIVMGVNRHYSLDHSDNVRFFKTISKLKNVKGVAYRIYGFFWHPQWQTNRHSPMLYPPPRAYRLIKALSFQSAANVLDLVEGILDSREELISQVSMQKIREQIKMSQDTCVLASYLENVAPASPTYFATMDGDSCSLRVKGMGLFSRIDKIAIENNNPSAITTGYSVADDELPLIRLGVKMDMYVRSAMNSQFPFGAYFPEPASFFCIRRANQGHFLNSLSFIGKGNDLENRRLIQNGLNLQLFDHRAVFLQIGGIVTDTPSRMKKGTTEKCNELTSKILKQKKTLKALRGISQSHATPKKWADSLYIAINHINPQVTVMTTPMMHIFSVFDPISRMYALNQRFSSKSYDKVMQNYKAPLSNVQLTVIQEAFIKLNQLGLSKMTIESIKDAAIDSGMAIYNVLKEAENGII